ncbi:hypothetical protein [Kingella kingae]|uniref:hypothetical protein n=1 Tax=Kingella kingae TaxID=504 RepID=UPI00254A9970|nr:hypothetical protein [Kingella kingae]MDK4530100.1 hypothetical protein [Kingella kingae]MDK4536268.1 hypothetical protein [Kingella kingae]MDK4539947.1 hypothetical protein [Kingella kingae]
MPTPLCTTRTLRSLSPCPNLNLNHYTSSALLRTARLIMRGEVMIPNRVQFR